MSKQLIIDYKIVSKDDRQKMEWLLAKKWAIKLPKGHPYEKHPPKKYLKINDSVE